MIKTEKSHIEEILQGGWIFALKRKGCSFLPVVPCRILQIIKRAGHKMEFFGSTANLTVASLALAVLRMDHTFEGMVFSIRSYEEGTDPEVSVIQGTERQSAKHYSNSSLIYSLGGRRRIFLRF